MILVSLFPAAQGNPHLGNQKKPPVELWCTGDDLLSQRMCQAFFAAFESNPDFDLQEENKPGNLIVTIPENVGWKKSGNAPKFITQWNSARLMIGYSWLIKDRAGITSMLRVRIRSLSRQELLFANYLSS